MPTLRLSQEAKAKRQKPVPVVVTPPEKPSKITRKAAYLVNEELRRQKVEAYRNDAADWLHATYPHLFEIPPRPLAIGITRQLIWCAPKGMVPAAIRYVMRLWCSTDAYLAARVPGVPRIGLSGEQEGQVEEVDTDRPLGTINQAST